MYQMPTTTKGKLIEGIQERREQIAKISAKEQTPERIAKLEKRREDLRLAEYALEHMTDEDFYRADCQQWYTPECIKWAKENGGN